MKILFWSFIFIISLYSLIKGADFLLEKSEKIGKYLKLSPFIIGILFVGIGTSMPELFSSIFGVIKGKSEIVTANVVGSNIANVLLIIGLSSIVARRLIVEKDIVDLDIPLLSLVTLFYLLIIHDGFVSLSESLLLIGGLIIYLTYTIKSKKEEFTEKEVILENEKKEIHKKLTYKDFILFIFGIFLIYFGAEYLIESVVKLSQLLNIAVGVISITAVAFGTSVPELLVSLKAAYQKKSEISVGNIFGSNIFNILGVGGISGLFGTLQVDEKTLKIGILFLIIGTFSLIISGLSKKIYSWEGWFYLFIYILFIGKIFNLF